MSRRETRRAETGKLLALDVSLRRIGVATCDPLRLLARPLRVIERRSRNEDFATLAALARQEEVEAVLCGLPLNMDGSEGERAVSIRKWAMKLAQALRALLGAPMPVIFWDERLSTFAAQEVLAEFGNRLDGTVVGEDAAAAAVILQSYLDAWRAGKLQDFGRIELASDTRARR